MNLHAQKLGSLEDQIKLGSFTKKDAVRFICQNIFHIHSTPLGEKDPSYQATLSKLSGDSVFYPWECKEGGHSLILTESMQQRPTIKKLTTETSFSKTSQNRDRLQLVLTELLSNGFYHAFKNSDGTDKYDRRKKVILSNTERLVLTYQDNSNGLYLSLTDNGGNLHFPDLKSRLMDCYLTGHNPVLENKHQGAGIGFFLVFEMSTHLSITVNPKHQTTISIWLASQAHFSSDLFSFNFFEG